jgi:two-component system LytT family sensor kinase
MARWLRLIARYLPGPVAPGYPGLPGLALAWTAVGLVAYARHFVAGTPDIAVAGVLPGAVMGLSCYLPWALLTAIVFDVERHVPLTRAGWPRSLLLLGAVSIPVVYAAWGLTIVFAGIASSLSGLPQKAHGFGPVIPAHELLGHQLLFWASVGAAWMLRTLLEARDNERRAARLMLEKSQLETSLRQTELDALRMRLQPHFLFNSLQNIAVLTEHDALTARRMLTKLADLLRASLGRDNRPTTTVAGEIALTSAYLAIERMRFGDRLSTLLDIAPDTASARVPSFLLQPIVENAIRHGLRGDQQRGVIVVRSRREHATLVLTVTDNGVGPGDAVADLPLGIGLGSTCERLARMYAGAHSFSMRAVPEGGTEVRITLPFETDLTPQLEESRAGAARAGRR